MIHYKIIPVSVTTIYDKYTEFVRLILDYSQLSNESIQVNDRELQKQQKKQDINNAMEQFKAYHQTWDAAQKKHAPETPVDQMDALRNALETRLFVLFELSMRLMMMPIKPMKPLIQIIAEEPEDCEVRPSLPGEGRACSPDMVLKFASCANTALWAALYKGK